MSWQFLQKIPRIPRPGYGRELTTESIRALSSGTVRRHGLPVEAIDWLSALVSSSSRRRGQNSGTRNRPRSRKMATISRPLKDHDARLVA